MEQNKKSRCHNVSCKKKVNIIGFDCKCGNRCCSYHIQYEMHNCKYDYSNKKCLKEKLIKVVGLKLPPI